MSWNSHITTWLFAGGLAASLVWNLRASGSPLDPAATTCEGALVLDDLALSPEQSRELERWKTGACEQSCRADAEANATLVRLHAALRDPDVDAERLYELAAEVSRLRAESLTACVDSIVAVRRVLTPEQLRTLLEHCCSAGACVK